MIDFEDEFPEDEYDYYQDLLNQSDSVGVAMIECKDPEERSKLTERYIELQGLLDSMSFANAFDND